MTAKQVEFYPPQMMPLLVRLCQGVAPLVGRSRFRMTLDVLDEDIERLRQLRGKRLLLLPNHPTFHDGMALFLLSARVGELFHFMVAYESFRGKNGGMLPRLGAYSVRRGLGDRASIAQTLELLSAPDTRLVIFPEGGCSFQNDTVMPFRSGAIQVALQAMNRGAKRGEAVAEMYAVPVSLKYRYNDDMEPVIAQTLNRLERVLSLPHTGEFYQRLERVSDRVLLEFERDYHLPQQPDLSREERIQRIRSTVLQACEQALDLNPPPTDPTRERVYRIQYTLENRAETDPDHIWTYDKINTAAARLLNFDAIYDGYVAAHPTPERFLDTLTRLERAVFRIDQPPAKGDRSAILRIGHLINLKDWLEDFQRDRTATVTTLTEIIRREVQANLDAINGHGQTHA